MGLVVLFMFSERTGKQGSDRVKTEATSMSRVLYLYAKRQRMIVRTCGKLLSLFYSGEEV